MTVDSHAQKTAARPSYRLCVLCSRRTITIMEMKIQMKESSKGLVPGKGDNLFEETTNNPGRIWYKATNATCNVPSQSTIWPTLLTPENAPRLLHPHLGLNPPFSSTLILPASRRYPVIPSFVAHCHPELVPPGHLKRLASGPPRPQEK